MISKSVRPEPFTGRVSAARSRADARAYSGAKEQLGVCLHVRDDVLDALADSVADDQEKELGAFESTGDIVDEDVFFHLAVHLGNDVKWRPIGTVPDLLVQVVLAPRREYPGAVEDLANHVPPRVRISPQLELCENDSADAGGSPLGKLVQDFSDAFQCGSVVVGPRAPLRVDRDP